MMKTRFGTVRWGAVRTLALRQWRSGWRSHRFTGVAVFVALTWPFRPPAVGLEAAAAPFTLAAVAALVLGAAVIARDYESGGMILDRLHGASPVETVLGSLLYTTTAAGGVAALLAAQLFLSSPELVAEAGWPMIASGLLSVAAMCALLVAFGSVAPGYANSAIVVGLIVVAPGMGEVERWGFPHQITAVFRFVRSILPLPHQLAATAAALTRGESPAKPLAIFAIGSVLAAAIAVLVVQRREPARGWRR